MIVVAGLRDVGQQHGDHHAYHQYHSEQPRLVPELAVDKLEDADERSVIIQLTRIKDEEDTTEDELIQIKVFQSPGKVG